MAYSKLGGGEIVAIASHSGIPPSRARRSLFGLSLPLSYTVPQKLLITLSLVLVLGLAILAVVRRDAPSANFIGETGTSSGNVEASSNVSLPLESEQQTGGTQSSSSESNGQVQTNVTVNGQSIPVPDDGSVHESMPTTDGQGQIDIHVENQSSGNSGGSSRLNIRSRSSSGNSSFQSQTNTSINSTDISTNISIGN